MSKSYGCMSNGSSSGDYRGQLIDPRDELQHPYKNNDNLLCDGNEEKKEISQPLEEDREEIDLTPDLLSIDEMKRERQEIMKSCLKMSLRIHKQDFVEGVKKIKTANQELSAFKDDMLMSVTKAQEILS